MQKQIETIREIEFDINNAPTSNQACPGPGLKPVGIKGLGRHLKNGTLVLACFIALNTYYMPTAFSQVGIGTNTPDASAILDLTSTTKGILISRVTLVQRNAIVSPATGLLIFQTDNTPAYYYNAGTPGVPNWVRLFSGSSAGGWDLSGNSGTTVGTNFLGTTDAQDFAVYTNNAERIRVTSGGNVGIGATTPATKLSLEGDDQSVSVARGSFNYNNTPMGAQFGSWGAGYTNAPGIKFHRWEGVATDYRSAYIGQAQGAANDWGIDFRTNSFGSLGDAVTSRMFISSTDGKIGIGTTVPEELLDIQGGDILLDNNQGIRIEKTGGFNKMVLELDDLDFTALHSGATTTGILFKDASDTEFARFTTAGNMGIGTPDPTGIATGSMLSVSGEGQYGQITSLTHSNSDPSGAYRLFGSRGTRVAPLALTGPDRFGFLVAHGYDGDSYASSAAVEFYVDGTVSTVDLPSKISFWTTDDGNLTRTEKMVIKNDGSVGIGTASPAALLEVSSTTSGVLIPRVTLVQRNAIVAPVTSELVFQTDNTPGYYYWDGAAWVQLLTASGTGSGWATTGNAGTTVGTNFLGTTDAQDFAIYTNNTEKLRIASAGNVGIGTISPIAKLDIASGDMHLSATQSIWAGILGTNEGRIEYYDGVSGDMTISTTWAGGNSDIIISPDNNTLFTTGNVAVSTGNVGIGTLSPLEDLHIEGATRVDMRFHDADELLDEKIWDYSTGVVGAKTFAFVTRDDAGVFGQTVWQAVRSGTNVSSVSFPNGNVGIGTTAPTDNLHIDRTDVNATITLDATSTGPNVASAIQHKRAGSLRWWVGASGNGGVDDYEWFRYDNTGGFLGTAMTIQRTTGNVGIGSTAPTSQLYISRGTGVAPHAFAQLTIEDDANNMINILSPITGLGYLAFGDAGDAYIGGVVYDHNDNSIDLVANNATRLSVTSAGNVGIGTVSPQGALDVVSTTGALIVPRMTTVQRDALTAVNGMIIYNITTNQFNFREGGVWVLK